jgi:hypothetical protein
MTVALDAAHDGMFVFPLWPWTKIPALHGARRCPRTGDCRDGHRGWEQRATRDLELIRRWWRIMPFNVAVAAGRSGLHVLDLDTAHGDPPPARWPIACHGRDVLVALAAESGEHYPADTRTVATPSGGLHMYFRAPRLPVLGNTVGRVGWRIDSRGSGGYIVAAGSTGPGGRYRVVRDWPIAPLPGWLVPLLTPPPVPPVRPFTGGRVPTTSDERRNAYLRAVLDRVATAQRGTRHDTLLRAAFTLGRLVGGGELTDVQARTGLLAAVGCWHGSPSRKDERTIADGLRAGADQPRRLAG